MKEMPRLIIVLTVISLLSGVVLAYTYSSTIDRINDNAELKKQKAIAEVLPGMERQEVAQKGDFTYYQGYDASGNPVGIAVEAVGGGFGGEIRLMVGLNPDTREVTAIKVLGHVETPGLGARISETGFRDNFINKPFGEYSVVKRPVSNPQEVEAISGATITSVAVSNIVQDTVKRVQEAFGGGQ